MCLPEFNWAIILLPNISNNTEGSPIYCPRMNSDEKNILSPYHEEGKEKLTRPSVFETMASQNDCWAL